jgi:hypothetical protein
VLIYGGLKRDPRIPDTPTIYEIFDREKTPEESRRVLADVILRGGDFGRPWVMPPQTPRENRQDDARCLQKGDGLIQRFSMKRKRANLEVEFCLRRGVAKACRDHAQSSSQCRRAGEKAPWQKNSGKLGLLCRLTNGRSSMYQRISNVVVWITVIRGTLVRHPP